MARTRLNAVAFISAQNHPILVRTFTNNQDDLKYHYVAHTSLDVIEERMTNTKNTDCYLGHLFSMEDLAVYGYLTPTRIRIVIALALTDAVVRDMDVVIIFKAFHLAYHQALSNPFLRLHASPDIPLHPSSLLTSGDTKWTGFAKRVDAIGQAVNASKGPEP